MSNGALTSAPVEGAPLASGTPAVADATPPFRGGAPAGDIIFNTNQSWNSTLDLLTAAVHEFGHALGLLLPDWRTAGI